MSCRWLSLSCAALFAAVLLMGVGLQSVSGDEPAAVPDDPFADNPFGGGDLLPQTPAKPGSGNKPVEKVVPPRKVRHLVGSAATKAIEAALKNPTQIEFFETPLQDVIDFLSHEHKIEIQIDVRALDDVGMGTDQPISKHLERVLLRDALELMLEELDLSWVIRNNVLLITTKEEAGTLLETKIYDVGDLVTCVDQKGQLWEDYETLSDVITSTVDPVSWEDVGGPGSVAGATFASAKVLVISQTREGHEEVADLLKQIRAVSKKNGQGEPPRRDRAQLHGPFNAHSCPFGGGAAGPKAKDPEGKTKDSPGPGAGFGSGEGFF
jgi:hypothetical protein